MLIYLLENPRLVHIPLYGIVILEVIFVFMQPLYLQYLTLTVPVKCFIEWYVITCQAHQWFSAADLMYYPLFYYIMITMIPKKKYFRFSWGRESYCSHIISSIWLGFSIIYVIVTKEEQTFSKKFGSDRISSNRTRILLGPNGLTERSGSLCLIA